MNSVNAELIAALLLLIHGVWRGRKVLRACGPGHFAGLLACTTSLTFGGGPWLSFVYGGFTLPEEPLFHLLTAYLAVGLFVLGCEFVRAASGTAQSQPPVTRRDQRGTMVRKVLQAPPAPPDLVVAIIYSGVVAVRVYLAIEYGIFFSGSGTGARMAQMSYGIVVLHQMTPILGGACLLCACSRFWSFKSMAGLISSCVIITLEWSWFATQGRRHMIEPVVLGMMSYLYSGRQIRSRELGVVAGILASLWFLVFPAFLMMRTSLMTHPDPDNPIAAFSAEASGDGIDRELANARHAENAASRLLIIRFVVRISEDQSRHELMHGSALISSLYRAIPAVVLGGKSSAAAPELAIQEHYEQPTGDTSTTWPAVGLADLGLLGALLAGVVFAFALEGAQKIADSLAAIPQFGRLTLRAFAIHSCVFVEECPSSLWSGLRNIVVICGVGWLLGQCIRFRKAGERRTQATLNHALPNSAPNDLIVAEGRWRKSASDGA